MELLPFRTNAELIDGNLTISARLTDLPNVVPLDQIPLFEGYSSSLLTFASATCIVFILVGLPGNLITIIALARCKKLNVPFSATGAQKLFEVVDEHKLRIFYEKRMETEVEADQLGDEWKGYILKIAGGNDKQGFPMKQGVLTHTRVRLLLKKGHSCYRPRRTGERKRKSVRGCIVDANMSVLALVVVRKGEKEVSGLTDNQVPRRASKIRKLYNLTKEDNVCQYVVRRPLPKKDGKKQRFKAPKIQRLVTPNVLQRKRHRLSIKKKRQASVKEQAAEYAKLLIS